MVNIDLKDRKILYQLDIDSRQSYRVIAKKVGLSKDGVSNRIARMQEKGIIKNFYTVVDTSPLGYIHPRFYIKYQYTNPEIKKEIIYHFVKSKYVGFVHELEGNYELAVAMVVKNITEFSNFWEKSMAKYRNYFANQSFSIYLSENMYRYSFLFDENATERFDTTNVQVFGGIKQVKIDELECNILKLITPDARMPLTIIAKKINSTTNTIRNRIKKIINLGVIKGFKVNVDLTKLGYKLYKTDIVLKEPDKHNKIINYIKSSPYLNHSMKSLGYVDLELAFYLENSNKLYEIMNDIFVRFPNAIRNYSYFSVIKTYKWNYMPEDLDNF